MIWKNIRIVNGSEDAGEPTDVAIRQDRVAAIGPNLSPESRSEQVFDYSGGYIMPGWFDIGCAHGDPGDERREDLQSLSEAALAGGFTAIAPLPNTDPPIHNKAQVQYLSSQTRHSPLRVWPVGAISQDCAGKDMAELYDMRQAGALAFSDGVHPVQDAGLLLRALQYARAFDGLIIESPQHQALTGGGIVHEGPVSVMMGVRGMPDIAEVVSVERNLRLLEYADGRLLIHLVSCAESVRLIRAAKSKGLRVSASVAIANLCFTDERPASFDSLWKVNPPLRSEADRQALIEGVLDGTIDVVCSNHAPWYEEAKNLEFAYAAFGMSALETFAACYAQYLAPHIPLPVWATRVALAPRRLLGLPEPRVEVGARADFTILIPDQSYALQPDAMRSKGKNSPLLNTPLTGKAIAVASRPTEG
ncbi:MAG: dihydroorotase [Saprospiraceae bacterium]